MNFGTLSDYTLNLLFLNPLSTDDDNDDGYNSKCRHASSIACCTAIGSVPALVFMIGVVLLGWSSFEFDTMQVNGECLFLSPSP